MKHYTLPSTLPAWNYFKIMETNDIRYLLKLDDYSDLPADCDLDELGKIFESIIYAMPEGSFDLTLKIEELELAKLENKAARELAPKYETLAQIQRNKIKNLIKEINEKGDVKFNLEDEIINIELILNVTIDIMTCSISKYMSYRKAATKRNAAIKLQQNKQKLN